MSDQVSTPAINPIILIGDKGKAVTSSQAVADYFVKRHDNLLRAIESLDCSPDFRLLNFEETSRLRKNINGGDGVPTKCYQMTKDGFMFLTMGFTGKKAAMVKEAYIKAFNDMEEKLNIVPTAARLPATLPHGRYMLSPMRNGTLGLTDISDQSLIHKGNSMALMRDMRYAMKVLAEVHQRMRVFCLSFVLWLVVSCLRCIGHYQPVLW